MTAAPAAESELRRRPHPRPRTDGTEVPPGGTSAAQHGLPAGRVPAGGSPALTGRAVTGLQGAAGNAAVARLLASRPGRQPSPTVQRREAGDRPPTSSSPEAGDAAATRSPPAASGAGAPVGPLSFLGGLSGASPSAFGTALATTAAAGPTALDSQRDTLQQQVPELPAPTGMPTGSVAPVPAPAAVPVAPLSQPTVSGEADPAVADQWSAVGRSAIEATAAGADVEAPSVSATVSPTTAAATLPAATLPATAPPVGPGATAAVPADQAVILDATMAGDGAGQVAGLLGPASSSAARHVAASTAVGAEAEAQVGAARRRTTDQQQSALAAADGEVAGLHSGWQAEKAAVVDQHQSVVAADTAQVRAETTQTMATASSQAKARADEAEAQQPSSGGGVWDAVKSAGRRAASAVGDVVSSAVSAVRGILDAARQRVLGAFARLAGAIRARVSAAVAALRAGVQRVAGAIAGVIRRAQALVSRFAAALGDLARSIWRAAAARLAALWQALQSAVRAALAAAGRVLRTIGSALRTVAEIVQLLSSKVLQTIFEALRDPQGKVVAPITAMAAPLAANVPPGMDERAQAHVDAGAPTSETPVVQREGAEPAPLGEGFFAGVWRHIKAAGQAFAADWGTILAKVVLGILLWFPMLVEEGPKLWQECKGVVSGGGGVDRLDHVLGVLRHLMNIVAGTLATAGVWGMLFAWAGTPIAEAATVAAYEALSMQVLAADVALSVLEMGKAWYSSTRDGISAATRELYLERFTGSLISTVIAGVMFALGAIASRLAKAFKLRTAAAVAGAEAEGGRPRPGQPGETTPRPAEVPEVPPGPRSAPLTAEEVATGVRMAKDLPDGGRLRLFADGRLSVCHSPCQSIATRFQRELQLGTPETNGFRNRLDTITAQERTAVAAADVAGEEAAFNAADVLNGELEAFRTRRLSGLTGVDEATVRTLITLAADDAALVERLLGRVANNHAKVRALLEVAGRDVNAVNRLVEMMDRFPAGRQPAGGVVTDPRFAPFATDANMPHFLERHSIDHFDFNQVKASNSYFPRGTTPADIQEAIVDTLRQIQRSGDKFPPNELRIKTLDAPPRLNGVTVQIVRDGGRIVQFFPMDGPGVATFTRQEMTAIGRFLGHLPL